MVSASRAAALLLVATTVLTVSCTRTVDDARAVAGADLTAAADPFGSDSSQCEQVDEPLTTIPARNDNEPVMKIPTPPGWVRTTMMDSELIRFAMRNDDLTTQGFTPNVVVTLESAPGAQDAALVFTNMREALESGIGATDVHVTEHTLCGVPARMFDYRMPVMGNVAPHPAVALGAVMRAAGKTFAVSVTAQTLDPEDPTYQRDSQTILDGFQLLPPSEG
ncbi:LpqN/LpqT family lipoprotein [Mycolicibacterium celeriflavum]|uniref:LpqN/LpqT family lipoprotein n=1 Tax=Mycolicibacterium celeriflavum TaxID=1249101 RepID=UPI003CEF182F